METLEHRLVLSTFLVSNPADSGPGSLRWAIDQANITAGADAIAFEASLADQPIVLGGTELSVSDDLTITGLGADDLTISGNNASRVFSIAAGVAVSISGVTIASGAADFGGGIYNEGTLTVANCILTNNSAGSDGGAIDNVRTLAVIDSILSDNSAVWGGAICNYSPDIEFPSSVTIANSTFTGDYAGRDGGGIWNDGLLTLTDSTFSANESWSTGGAISNTGTLDITNGIFSGNKTTYGARGGGNGGAIANHYGGKLTVTGSAFSQNAAGTGAAIDNMSSTLDVTASTFFSNSAQSGGAVWTNGPVKIAGSTLSNNEATTRWGGAIYTYSAQTVEIKDSTLSGNFAKAEGGAIDNNLTTLRIINTTISGNSTDGVGGAIYDWGGPLEITNSTLTGNRADANGDGYGDGGALYDDGGGPYLMHNSIVAGNVVGKFGADSPDDFSATLNPASANNLIGDPATAGGLVHGENGNIVGDGAGGLIDIATVLDPNLADNGGPTWTHALVRGGPAVNAGDNTKAVDADGNPLASDQRGEGFARIYAGTVDIGAFEDQPLSVQIDVKPGSDTNPLNLAASGVIAVVIFTTDSFDASLVDARTVEFAGASAVQTAVEDVDGDGDLDMVLHFRVRDTNLADLYAQLLVDDPDADGTLNSSRRTAAVSLTGQTATDEYFAGFDEVDLFLSGRNLRDFLDRLASAGAI